MATDFRDGKTFPRRGRESLGGFLWILRAFDKARAAADGTLHDYIYPCPMDKGVMERWGTTPGEFDAAVAEHRSDEQILAWLEARVGHEARERANRWLVEDKAANMDRQDAEEGVGIAS